MRSSQEITYSSQPRHYFNLISQFQVSAFSPIPLLFALYPANNFHVVRMLWCNRKWCWISRVTTRIHPKILFIDPSFHSRAFFLQKSPSCTTQRKRNQFSFTSQWSLITFLELWIILLIWDCKLQRKYLKTQIFWFIPKLEFWYAQKCSRKKDTSRYFILCCLFLSMYLNTMQQQSNWFLINSTDKTKATAHKTQS